MVSRAARQLGDKVKGADKITGYLTKMEMGK